MSMGPPGSLPSLISGMLKISRTSIQKELGKAKKNVFFINIFRLCVVKGRFVLQFWIEGQKISPIEITF